MDGDAGASSAWRLSRFTAILERSFEAGDSRMDALLNRVLRVTGWTHLSKSHPDTRQMNVNKGNAASKQSTEMVDKLVDN